MLDVDLAEMYQVSTKVLNQAVKRNPYRFPPDFMFQLIPEERNRLKSQFATSSLDMNNRSQFVTGSQKHRDPKFLPYAFTEHGVAMLSSVLKSSRAVAMNIAIIRAFIKFREMLSTQKDMAHKMLELEKIQKEHGSDITDLYSIIKKLIYKPPVHSHPSPPPSAPAKNPIGFVRPNMH